jgi:hypothetical protein
MNKKTVSAVLLFSMIVISFVVGVHVVEAGSTDAIHFYSGVTLFSPLNQTYNSRYLTLNFSVACGWGIRYSLSYDIDGKYGGPMPFAIKNPEELHVVFYGFGLVRLPELSEGSHRLTVTLKTSENSEHIKPSYVDTVYFSIDSTPLDILLLSPENKTYAVAASTAADIPLKFTCNERTSQISYSLDGHENATIVGNMTLTDLPIGTHNVTVYARDSGGNAGVSETVIFAVAGESESQAEMESFSTTVLLAASGASIGFIGVGLMVYLKKLKH